MPKKKKALKGRKPLRGSKKQGISIGSRSRRWGDGSNQGLDNNGLVYQLLLEKQKREFEDEVHNAKQLHAKVLEEEKAKFQQELGIRDENLNSAFADATKLRYHLQDPDKLRKNYLKTVEDTLPELAQRRKAVEDEIERQTRVKGAYIEEYLRPVRDELQAALYHADALERARKLFQLKTENDQLREQRDNKGDYFHAENDHQMDTGGLGDQQTGEDRKKSPEKDPPKPPKTKKAANPEESKSFLPDGTATTKPYEQYFRDPEDDVFMEDVFTRKLNVQPSSSHAHAFVYGAPSQETMKSQQQAQDSVPITNKKHATKKDAEKEVAKDMPPVFTEVGYQPVAGAQVTGQEALLGSLRNLMEGFRDSQRNEHPQVAEGRTTAKSKDLRDFKKASRGTQTKQSVAGAETQTDPAPFKYNRRTQTNAAQTVEAQTDAGTVPFTYNPPIELPTVEQGTQAGLSLTQQVEYGYRRERISALEKEFQRGHPRDDDDKTALQMALDPNQRISSALDFQRMYRPKDKKKKKKVDWQLVKAYEDYAYSTARPDRQLMKPPSSA